MATKEISVKKYVVRLSGEERERLEALIRKGKSPAQRLLKARILLKADASEAGEGWSDSRIIKALETSASMIYRVRRQLVEEGFEAVWDARAGPCGCWRTRSWNSTLSIAPATQRSGGHSKKHSPAPSPTVLGHPAQGQ